MIELKNRIALLEMRAEQLGIHLQSLDRHSRDAEEGRSQIYAIVQELTELKADRERLNPELQTADRRH
jgi:hypothetical protein